MSDHHHDVPRRGADCGRPRSVGAPDGAFDAALPILRELEHRVHDAVLADDAAAIRRAAVRGVAATEPTATTDDAETRGSAVQSSIGHSAITPDPDAGTATVPSRSVRRNGTPAS